MIILLNLQFIFRKGHTIATAYCVRIAVRIFIGARDCFIAKGLMKPEVGFYSPSSAGPYQMCLPSQVRNKLCVHGKAQNQKAPEPESPRWRLKCGLYSCWVRRYIIAIWPDPMAESSGSHRNCMQTINLALINKQCWWAGTDGPQNLFQNHTIKNCISCLDQMSVPCMCFRKTDQTNSRPAGINPLSTPILMMS